MAAEEQSSKRTKAWVALILNVAIVIMVAYATVLMVTTTDNGPLAVAGEEAFKFYTVDSNVLEGIAALVSALYGAKALFGKQADGASMAAPRWMELLKLTSTAAVTLTFLVVIFFLMPITGDFDSMYKGGNFFMHLVVPILAVIVYAVVERPARSTRRERLICLIPTVIYAVFYGINALTHIQDGAVPAAYDWYHFLAAGPWSFVIVAPLILAINYLIVFVIDWLANRAIK